MPVRVRRELLLPFHVTGFYFALALLSFAAASLVLAANGDLLIAGVFRQWRILLAVHLYTLGLGTAAILGALNQLGPVLLQTDPPPPRPAFASALIYAAGFLTLISGLAAARPGAVLAGGLAVTAGAAGALAGIVRVWRRRTQSAAPLPFFGSGVIYLALLLTLGLLLAVHWQLGFPNAIATRLYGAHVLIGAAGWFGFLILGTSYFLIPFFGVIPTKAPGTRSRAVFAALHLTILGGLAELAVGSAPRWSLAPAVIATALFLWDHRRAFAPAPGRENAIKWGVRWAHAYLAGIGAAAIARLLGLSFGNGPIVALGLCFFAGWVTNSVIAYQHRILPFLAWHTRYMGKKGDVPYFSRMVNHTVGIVALAAYNAGLLGAAISIGLQLPLWPGWLVLLAASALTLAANLAAAYFK